MASGGARKGAGAKPNQHRIASGELRRALEKALGIPYVQMLAETQVKLFRDFKNDLNVKEYIRFTENMSSRILEQQTQEVSITSELENLSNEEIQQRINNLLTRSALTNSETDIQDGNEENETL